MGDEAMDKDTKNIFILGLCVLFAWMAVIIVCASPQLFRDWIRRRCCGCLVDEERKRTTEKIKAAEERVRQASECLGTRCLLSENAPSSILIHQATRSYPLPPIYIDVIMEEDRSLSPSRHPSV